MLDNDSFFRYYYRNGQGWGFFYRTRNEYFEIFYDERWTQLGSLADYDVAWNFQGPFESLETMYEALFKENSDTTCIENFQKFFL